MHKTLADSAARDALLRRIESLTPETPALWGRMCADEMLAHVVAGMRMAYGEFETKQYLTPFRYWPLKYLFIYAVPFPRGARAPRELVTRNRVAPEWDANMTRLRELITRFPEHARETQEWAVHPIFGTLSGNAWGALGWRHLDHHLRQFGA